MSGILPNGGVPPSQANNTLPDANISPACPSLWYAPRCNPRFDPDAANAVISEIINAVNCANLQYDCTKLDNLCRAIKALAAPGTQFSICALPPHANPIVDTDTVGGCFTDVDSTMTIAELKALITGASNFFKFAEPLVTPNNGNIPLADGDYRFITGINPNFTTGGGGSGTQTVPGVLFINNIQVTDNFSGPSGSFQRPTSDTGSAGILHRKGTDIWYAPVPPNFRFASDSTIFYGTVSRYGTVAPGATTVFCEGGTYNHTQHSNSWKYSTGLGVAVAAPT